MHMSVWYRVEITFGSNFEGQIYKWTDDLDY